MNSPYEIYHLCNFYGFNKTKIPKIKLLILSIFGGFFVGSGAALSLICSYRFVGGLSQYYSGLVFPIGIIASYCAGGELFTETCLLIMPFFIRSITVLEMLLTWLIVYIGNFIGTILVSLLIVYGHIPNMFEANLAQNFITLGIAKCSLGFGEAFIKGLLCNFYNCLAYWVGFGGRETRSIILALWIPCFLFAACDLEHCIANMYYITAALFTCYEYGLDNTTLNWGRLFYKNLIPVTLGNILGGVGLVGMAYSYIYSNNEIEKNQIEHNKMIELNDSKHAMVNNDLSTLNSMNNN